ncbi:MAG: 23S rRNA (guanosine(2251)-2'-O)-methyltransferase RlmB [bacterium]|nr:23S rRNA (guanosine(2251)-2'-O)-methyltransferase RlmB [bacterium]
MNISSLNVLLEALESGSAVHKVFVATTRKDKKITKVIELCRKAKISYQMVPQQLINKKAGPDNQGVYAEMAPIEFVSLEEILQTADKGLILILDSINDTGNMGAIIRSAAAAGVDGVIIARHNCAPINETVLKTSAGTLLKVKVHQAGNLNETVRKLKKNDYWVVGADMKGTPYYDYDFTYKTAIIMGSEHKGISPLLAKNTDHLLSIPHSGDVESLNVSAATAVILFEALRQARPRREGVPAAPGKAEQG